MYLPKVTHIYSLCLLQDLCCWEEFIFKLTLPEEYYHYVGGAIQAIQVIVVITC
jgi:hypothetical protein